MKAENSTDQKMEFIYEIDGRCMEASRKRENQNAIAEGREQQTISDKIYALGGIDYVNIVAQSDEIS